VVRKPDGWRIDWLSGLFGDVPEVEIDRAWQWRSDRVGHPPSESGAPVTIVRPMMRCLTCRRWWSGEPQNGHVQHCACGGELKPVDMEAHLASLPQKLDTDEERRQMKLQEETAAEAKRRHEEAAKK
jgi:hypothetical protein